MTYIISFKTISEGFIEIESDEPPTVKQALDALYDDQGIVNNIRCVELHDITKQIENRRNKKPMFLGEYPRKFFKNTVLESRDLINCGRFLAPVSIDNYCLKKCPFQSSCDTFAIGDDETKLLDGEAWECASCRRIVNKADDRCPNCKLAQII